MKNFNRSIVKPTAVDDILNDLESMTALFSAYKRCGGKQFQVPMDCFHKIVVEKATRIIELSATLGDV